MPLPPPPTLVHALLQRAELHSERPALWAKPLNTYLPFSFREYAKRVENAARGLETLGFKAGEGLALIGTGSEAWVVSALAAMALGGWVAPLDAKTPWEEALSRAKPKALLVRDAETLRRALEVQKSVPGLVHLIASNSKFDRPKGVLAYPELLARGQAQAEAPFAERLVKLTPKTIALKSVNATDELSLSHANLLWSATRIDDVFRLRDDDVHAALRPMSVLAEFQLAFCAPLLSGGAVVYPPANESFRNTLLERKPTVFFATRDVYVELRRLIEDGLMHSGRAEKAILDRAREITRARHESVFERRPVPAPTELAYRAAKNGPVFNRVKQAVGLENARVLLSEVGELGVDSLRFFASLDLVVREVFTSNALGGFVAANEQRATRLGTAGRPIRGIEVRIGDDRALSIRGENLSPAEFRASGRFAELDGDGFLTLVSGQR